MLREQAYEIVIRNGGIISDNVTKKTNILVDASPVESSKVRKAKDFITKGHNIKIINESEFIDLFEESE